MLRTRASSSELADRNCEVSGTLSQQPVERQRPQVVQEQCDRDIGAPPIYDRPPNDEPVVLDMRNAPIETNPAYNDGKSPPKDVYGDPSSKMWALYLAEAKKDDRDITDAMTADTNGVLVFTGLFAAIIAAFTIESYKMLQPDLGDERVALLSHIAQQLAAASSSSLPFDPLPIPNSESFRPPNYAVRLNVLWFLSLTLSLLCALTATLMQQWARRYLANTAKAQRAGSPQRQGRIHAYLSTGLQTFGMRSAVEMLPALLHASGILFFAGLIDFLFIIHTVVACVVLASFILAVLAYIGLTVLPFFFPNSPYATPLTSMHALFLSPSRRLYAACRPLAQRRIDWEIERVADAAKRRTADVETYASMEDPHSLSVAVYKLLNRFVINVVDRTVVWIGTEIIRTATRICHLLERWRAVTHSSSLGALEDAAASYDQLERWAVEWTLTMVVDVDAEFLSFVKALPSFLASSLQLHSKTEIVKALATSGFGSRLGQLLASTAAPDASQSSAPRGRRITACLRSLGHLATIIVTLDSVLWTQIFVPILAPLRQLQHDHDPDVAVGAWSVGAEIMLSFERLLLRLPYNSLPHTDVAMGNLIECLQQLYQADLQWDVHSMARHLWWIRDYDYPLGRALGIIVFVRDILPLLPVASPQVAAAAWTTLSNATGPLFREDWDALLRDHHTHALRTLTRLRFDLRKAMDLAQQMESVMRDSTSTPGPVVESLYVKLCETLLPLLNWWDAYVPKLEPDSMMTSALHPDDVLWELRAQLYTSARDSLAEGISTPLRSRSIDSRDGIRESR